MGVPTPTATFLAFSSAAAPSPPALGIRPIYPSFLPKQSAEAAAASPFDRIFLLRSSRTALKSSSSSSNKTKPPPLPKTEDPFLLLGLDSRNPTTDKKEIKRAYRKRAMQYHPDVILGTDSTEHERDEASKDFARINAAYEMLSGGAKGGVGAGSTSGGDPKSSSGGYNYQPPHRRTSGYSSGSYGKSTNWEDFMPNYDQEDAKYDADGDSFGSIFSDLVTGAAGYAAGAGVGGSGGGIFGDFIEFLEGNIDGFESGYDDDKALSQLLMYGTFEEVASEMDETDILVTSLETKLGTVENELMQVQADLNVATRFSEKLDIEERMAELKAREKVVKGYTKKGKKRLLRLREKYKELMVEGRGGRGYGGSSSSGSASWSGSYNSSSQNGSYSSDGSARSSSSYSRASEPTPSASSTASTSSTPSSSPASSSKDGWRNEGFSSSYGRRSSGSRRSSRRNRGATNTDASRPAAEQQPQQQRRGNENTYSSSAGSSSGNAGRTTSSSNKPVATQQTEPWVPPHRRTQSSAERNAQDKKRLRELKVDDDFEKLKREMGM